MFNKKEKKPNPAKEKFKLRIFIAGLILILLAGLLFRLVRTDKMQNLQRPNELVGLWETFADEHQTVLKFKKNGYIKQRGKRILIWGVNGDDLYITPYDTSIIGPDEPMVVTYKYKVAPDGSSFTAEGLRNDGQEVNLVYFKL